MKIAVVAEREEVELERLRLHHPLVRYIPYDYSSEIRLPSLGTQGCELGTVQRDNIVVFRVFVDESLQQGRVVIVCISGMLVAQ